MNVVGETSVREAQAARVAHLSADELRLASTRLETPPHEIEGPWEGLIVGEMPARRSSGRLPLFPWPVNSSGGRLLKLAGMSRGAFLGRLRRRNLHAVYGDYSAVQDAVAANAIRAELLSEGSTRVVLLGVRVAAAFGLSGIWTRKSEVYDQDDRNVVIHEMIAIGHPSHDSFEYRDSRKRDAARTALWYAAGMLDR